MRRTLSQSCCAVAGPKDAFVPGSSLSVSSSGSNSFDQGTVCNTVRYPLFCRAHCTAPVRVTFIFFWRRERSLRVDQLSTVRLLLMVGNNIVKRLLLPPRMA